MSEHNVSAVLFVKDLAKVTRFYVNALQLTSVFADEYHSRLKCRDFELIVHQIPKHIADQIAIETPPTRRVWGAIRLDYPVQNLDESRRIAKSLGGGIDDAPPEWADRDTNFFLAYDPEGNQFGVAKSL